MQILKSTENTFKKWMTSDFTPENKVPPIGKQGSPKARAFHKNQKGGWISWDCLELQILWANDMFSVF